jgi:UTP--glucose-1-phosphate uridylyltransferase
MLVVVDKPLIQYAVEEARDSGIEKFIFITSHGKAAIEDHFDVNYPLEQMLEHRGKTTELAILRSSQLDPGQAVFCSTTSPVRVGTCSLVCSTFG